MHASHEPPLSTATTKKQNKKIKNWERKKKDFYALIFVYIVFIVMKGSVFLMIECKIVIYFCISQCK